MRLFTKSHFICWGLIAAILYASGTVSAERPEKMRGWTKKVHSPIPVQGLDHAAVRLAVLQGMFYTKSYSWQLEKETDNIITTRFDYRGDSVILDIVYTTEQVYIDFVDGNGFECRKLEEGVCFENDRNYYNYAKNLRASIAQQISKMRSRK